MSEVSPLIAFYRDQGPAGSSGRTLAQILDFSHEEMEQTHDYIQWLFPLPEPSRFNPEAPILTPEDLTVFRDDLQVRANALVAFKKYLEFLAGTEYWLRPSDHNLLRITRVIRFLVLIEAPQEASRFRQWCEENHPDAPPRTAQFWRDALDAEMPGE